ncbi:hypothetical protein B0H14DRAFT_2359784, partial [Mycena olivaceomarginata]
RRFLRHPILKTFLATKFPHNPLPTLSHLHISLANRSRIKSYIKQIKELHCPFGTGWQGSYWVHTFPETCSFSLCFSY